MNLLSFFRHELTYIFSDSELEPQVTYKVRVLAGTEVGYSTLGDKHWPWMEYTTPRLNDSK